MTMRITAAAQRLGISPRMLRYREAIGLLPGARPAGHRTYTETDLAAVALALSIEQRYDISPAALAFGLRVLTDPAARSQVAELGRADRPDRHAGQPGSRLREGAGAAAAEPHSWSLASPPSGVVAAKPAPGSRCAARTAGSPVSASPTRYRSGSR